MLSEMTTMITGRPTHKERKEILTLQWMTTPDLVIRKHPLLQLQVHVVKS